MSSFEQRQRSDGFCNCAIIEKNISAGGGPHVFWTCGVHGLRIVRRNSDGRRYAVRSDPDTPIGIEQ